MHCKNEAVMGMHQEIASLDDYLYFIDKFKNQRGIAEHFKVSPTAVSHWHLKLKINERVNKKQRSKQE